MIFKSQNLTQASGSVGGLSYTHGKTGMIMRARSKPIVPSANRATAAAAEFAQAMARWRTTLTPAQRDRWQLYARNVATANSLGDERYVRGSNWFLARQLLFFAITRTFGPPSHTFPNNAPTRFDRGVLAGFQLTFAESETGLMDITADASTGWLTSGGGLLVYVNRPANASRAPNQPPWRMAAWFDGDTAGAPPYSFSTLDFADTRSTAGQLISLKAIALFPDHRTSSAAYSSIIVG